MPSSTTTVTFSHQDPFKLKVPCSKVCLTGFRLVFQSIALFKNERRISKPAIPHSFVSTCVDGRAIGFNDESDVTQ